MRTAQERTGLTFAALCAANGAFVPALAKLTTNAGDAFLVAAASAVFGGIAAALVLAVRGELARLLQPAIGPRLALVGALGTAGAFLLFFAGAARTSAIETVLCLQMEPAYALVLAWIFLGQRPTRRRVLGTTVLLIGITLAVGGNRVVPSLGVWLLLATPLCWQISHLIVLRRLVGVSPHVLTGGRYIFGGALLAVIWLLRGGVAALPRMAELRHLLPLLAVQGVILGYSGTLLWYQAVTRLDLARATAIVVPSIPVLSLLASFVLLGEVPSAYQTAGLVLTAVGVLTFVTAPHATTAESFAADKQPTVSAA